MRSYFSSIRKDEQGVLLVVALIVLGVIVLSGVYLSLIMLNEIRSTRFADNSIIAHYVAESGAEEGLWRLKVARIENDPSFFDVNYAGYARCAAEDGTGGVGCLASPPEANTDPERIYDFVALSLYGDEYTVFDTERNSVAVMDIYDPNIEGTVGGSTQIDQLNVDWFLEGSCQGSSRLEITYTPIDIETLGLYGPLAEDRSKTLVDVCGCSGPGSNNLFECEPLSPYSASFTVSRNNFYRVSFRPLDHDVKKIVVSASDTQNMIAALTPSIVTIETSGVYRDARSTIDLRAHWRDALSGIFNYVIFSEESLIKDVPTLSSSAFASSCGVCDDGVTACSIDQDCGVRCETLNASAFCSDTSGGESFVSYDIHQTDIGLCNAYCNGRTFCGDGTPQQQNGAGTGGTSGTGDEECDEGGLNSDVLPDTCRTSCLDPYCGDGIADTGEACDDGSTSDTFGNNQSDDDGECVSDSVQSVFCQLNFCGDGYLYGVGSGGAEECDDGNNDPNDGCDPGCLSE